MEQHSAQLRAIDLLNCLLSHRLYEARKAGCRYVGPRRVSEKNFDSMCRLLLSMPATSDYVANLLGELNRLLSQVGSVDGKGPGEAA